MTNPDRPMLDLAARAALRAAGFVEPNPMVGAAIVRDGQLLGLGHHRRFGGPHAEREALADCRRRGETPRGATIYVTLEPCSHHGKTPPCTDAIIEAGIARVVAARPDPHHLSRGGAGVLARAGIPLEFSTASPLAAAISDPFIKRTTTGLPWVIAKWAQSTSGRMVPRPGDPRWISNDLVRRRVHRLRARVDAVITTSATVLADDPRLTVRGVRPRRIPARVVIDWNLRTPPAAALVQTARDVPTIIACVQPLASSPRAAELRELGVELLPLAAPDVDAALRELMRRLDATNVLIEAGPRFLASAIGAGIVDEAVAHVAPRRGGDRDAIDPREQAPSLEGSRLAPWRSRMYGDNTEVLYRASGGPSLRLP